MTSDFVTKRPHKKSRAGCITCKTRKIKCDEKHPTCAFCALRNIECIYVARPNKLEPSSPVESRALVRRSESTSSSSDDGMGDIPLALEPTVITSTRNLTTFDLRLMHHYSMYTWNALSVGNVADTNGVLQVRVPQLAFEHDFLMSAVLGMASLHLQVLVPHSVEIQQQTDMYRGQALAGFRNALNNINSDNFEAALIMSLLLLVLVSKDYPTHDDDLYVNHWLGLYRGLSAVMMMKGGIEGAHRTSVGPIFRRNLTALSVLPAVPQLLLDMLATIPPDDPEYSSLEIYCGALDSLGILFASLQSDGLGAALNIRTISWPSYLKAEFVVAVKTQQPRALIIISYFLVFTKLVGTLWWVDGIAERDISVIERTLEPKWLPLIHVPCQAARMDDLEAIAKLVLGC
ncbi:Sterol regulatory element-binding protein ECM22-like protein 2 [Phlyctema vagabunda]|uniref:Sterol regulatory element-binding protein ECM22-like protein 2 n=1 Tax=Phlyctema vagabunda TaxID=108571 RepID=A0ABR4PD41_9HELO